ncbi:MAG TPA: EAL domain-containing protein [Spongiibacteraceae bacterium]|nr:EAL domain-containing protein [Spongiibacteraceae bacterium]
MTSLTLLHRELSLPMRCGLAVGIFALALLLRFLIMPVEAGFPFATLYPATAAIYYFCGTRPGLLATLLSAVAGCYIFIPPHWTFIHETADYYIVILYLVGSLLMALLVYQLQGYAANLHKTLLKLHDSENRFRSFMDNTNLMSWMKDEDGRYIYINAQGEKHFALAPGSWQGKADSELFSAAIAEQFGETDRQVLQTGKPLAVEESITAASGEVFHWLSTKFPYVDSGGTRFFGGIAVDITARKIAEAKIESLAFYDPLTGLPNRRHLLERLAHVLDASARHGRLGALLFIDLDNFKTLNDTCGHDQGDLLLQMVAERLTTNIRKGDTLARLGGDEFVVLLEDVGLSSLAAAAQAEIVAEKILATLGEPYQLGDNAHRSTLSIGITLFGEFSESIEEPLKRADLAMYQAKAAGRNTLRFFDPQIQAAVEARAVLEADLRAAITEQRFLLHYQPQVTGTDQIIGAEALVRWHHAERGLVAPAEFIPLAEDTGLIVPLGRWVLDAACQQLALWARQPATAHLTIAVNVSPRQFHQADFVQQVLAALTEAGANPQRLKLELTEGLLVTSIGDVISKMARLKSEGIGFALDDFGTGYSSLAYLKRLPLDQLKIDQSFVKDMLVDPNGAVIAKTIIALAGNLGLTVIAEGVESAAQRDFLAAQGCSAYQGYLFGRPLPIGQFEALLMPA